MTFAAINKGVISSDTMDAGNTRMREFILLAESYLANETFDSVEVEVETVVAPIEAPLAIISDLNDVAYRLRAFMETESGEFSLGVETGMQRAADMIENLIKRHTTDGGYIG